VSRCEGNEQNLRLPLTVRAANQRVSMRACCYCCCCRAAIEMPSLQMTTEAVGMDRLLHRRPQARRFDDCHHPVCLVWTIIESHHCCWHCPDAPVACC